MSDRIALDPDVLSAALRVLRREQSAYLPTRLQLFFYRALNVSAFSIVAAGLLWLISGGMAFDYFKSIFHPNHISLLEFIAQMLAMCSAIGMFVLFPANLGLMR